MLVSLCHNDKLLQRVAAAYIIKRTKISDHKRKYISFLGITYTCAVSALMMLKVNSLKVKRNN